MLGLSPAVRLASLAAIFAASLTAQGPILINEVHGFGGGASPVLSGDYVEFWNTSTTPINLAGWTLGIWIGNTGPVTTYVLPSAYISGRCFFVVQEGGTPGAPLSDASFAGVPGVRSGLTFPWQSNSSIGAYLKSPAGVNSDYVYLYRAATPPPVPAPFLAAAGTGAAFTPGTVSTTPTGKGHLKRMTNTDGNNVLDWTQDATANVGTPGAINTSGGAMQTSLGICVPFILQNQCFNGQQNSPQATFTISGTTGSTVPYNADVYPQNEPITFQVSSSTLPGAPFYLFASPACNVGHFNDLSGNYLDLGFSGAGFCDIDVLSLGFSAGMCGGGPFLPLANLDAAGLFTTSFDAPGLTFPKIYFQVGILDFSLPYFVRMTAATGLTAKAGVRYRNGPGLPAFIPDGVGSPGPGAPLTADIVVPQGVTIVDLNVDLQIGHEKMGDLTVTLTHVEAAVSVPLLTAFTPNDASSLGSVYTFNDEATQTFDAAALAASGSVPAGTYLADGALSAFDGLLSAGTWRLTVTDHSATKTGALFGFTIYVNTGN
jgi:hypothetical protein